MTGDLVTADLTTLLTAVGDWALADDWRPADLLPAAYVAAIGLGLAALLKRAFDPLPRLSGAVFSLLLAILFGPVLLGGKALLPLDNLRSAAPYAHLPPSRPGGHSLQSDLVFEIAPHQVQVRRAFARGEWPLWNELVGAGMPLLADPQAQAVQPFAVLGWPFPLAVAAGVTAALRVGAAFAFGFVLFRRLGFGDAAALLASSAYGLSGCVQLWLGWPLANATALLPAVLYGLTRCFDEGGRRDAALLAIATVAVLLGGQPETILYCLGFAALVFMARAWTGWRHRRSPRGAVLVIAAWSFALAITAPALLLAREYLPKTQRAVALETAFGNRDVLAAARALARPEVLSRWRERAEQRATGLVAARAWGDHSIYRGETNVVEDAAGFAGTGAVLLALLSLFGPVRFRHERLVRWSLLACALLLLQPPGFDIATYHLPFVGFTAAHKHRRILMLIAFCTCYLAASGLERWRLLENPAAIWRRRVGATAAALAGVLAWAYLVLAPADAALLHALRQPWFALQGVVLLTVAALLVVQWPRRRSEVALTATVIAELLIAHIPANIPNSRRLAYPETAGIGFLKSHLADPRGTVGARLVGLGRTLHANSASVHGLADVRISNASTPAAYEEIVAELHGSSGEALYGRPRDPLYDLLGARYVAARPGARLDLPEVYQGPDLAIFERSTALPRLFLPRSAEIQRGGGSVAWVHANPDFAGVSLVGVTPAGTATWMPSAPGPVGFGVVEVAPTRIRAWADLPERRLVASSVLQDGNWTAYVDRDPHPVLLANGPFVATWMPAGRHRLTLLYRPRAFLWGCWIAAVAIALALSCGLPAPPRGSSIDAPPGA